MGDYVHSVSAYPTRPVHIPISASIQARRLWGSQSRTPVSGLGQKLRKCMHDCRRTRTNHSNGCWGGSESDSRLMNHKPSRYRSIGKSWRLSTKRRTAGTLRQAITKSRSVHLRTTRHSQETSQFIETLTNKRVFHN